MPNFNMSFPHRLSPDEALSRIKNLLRQGTKEIPAKVIGRNRMTNGEYKKAIDPLLRDYFSLVDKAAPIHRKLKQEPNADARSKLIAELRSIDKKGLELLDQMADIQPRQFRT
jgi:hypothetical protein